MTYAPPYTAPKPPLSEDSDALRARIPGWGADLDPADRPSVPRERMDAAFAGAHWEAPERQVERWPRERSVEHTQLPPVFGTTCPPRWLSGAIRKHAYAAYSEGQAAHWLLLMAGDRIDVVENRLQSLLTLRPDNPITESGVLSEVRRHGARSRLGQQRADLKHLWLDPVVTGLPWVAAAYVARRLVKHRAGR